MTENCSFLLEGTMKKLLEIRDAMEFLIERTNVTAEGKFIVEGILQRADAKNGNGRVYPFHILRREVENYKQLVKERRALGELDHPDSPVVELKNASHLVVDIQMNGKDVFGRVEILPTTAGTELRKLFEADVKLGISSRGLGSTREENGSILVEDDFQLICFDFVSDPSTQGAFMERVLRENKSPEIFSKTYKINRILNDILGV